MNFSLNSLYKSNLNDIPSEISYPAVFHWIQSVGSGCCFVATALIFLVSFFLIENLESNYLFGAEESHPEGRLDSLQNIERKERKYGKLQAQTVKAGPVIPMLRNRFSKEEISLRFSSLREKIDVAFAGLENDTLGEVNRSYDRLALVKQNLRHSQKTTLLPPSSTDCEYRSRYNYNPSPCNDLLTDITKHLGYPIIKELSEVTQLPDSNEIFIGARLAKQYELMYKDRLDINKDWVRYVDVIGKFLVEGRIRKGIAYHFHVIDSDTLSAFSIPGGGVYVYRGLLENIQNEAQLAFILAHEIGHIDLRHCIAMSEFMMNLPQSVRKNEVFTAAEIVKGSFRTEIELEADYYALRLCYIQNYSPYQGVRLFLTIMSEGLSHKPSNIFEKILTEIRNISESHPQSRYRACKMKNYIIELQKEMPKEKVYLGENNYRLKVPLVISTF